jgi:hypothetical protein
MANMTVTAPESTQPRRLGRLNTITFTHTAAGTAGGDVAAAPITGTLLRMYTDDGGDGAWDCKFTASGTDIWEITGLGTSAQSRPISVTWDGTTPDGATDTMSNGIPVMNEAITCTTANMSGSGTGPAITLVYREG